MLQKVNDYEKEKVVNQNLKEGKAAFGFRKYTARRIQKSSRICYLKMPL